MDTQAQMLAIIDRLLGAPAQSPLHLLALDEPWHTIYSRIEPAGNRTEAMLHIQIATEGLGGSPDLSRKLARDLIALLPDDDTFASYPSLDEMPDLSTSVDWLWPAWIPRRQLTLFGAAPGAGKSLVALDLARRIIDGQPFPDGTPNPCPGSNVLIVDAEGAPDLLNQRARAWDIDRRRLFLMLAPGSGLIDLEDGAQKLRLLDMIRQVKPSLVVIDSLAATSAHAETSLQAARSLFGFLGSFARRANLALLVIHHLRKRARPGALASTPRVAAGDLRGTSHLGAAARSILALSVVAGPPTSPFLPDVPGSPDSAPGPHGPAKGTLDPTLGPHDPTPGPHDPAPGPSGPGPHDQRCLEIVKTNLCRRPPPLGVIFEGQDMAVPTLRYTEFVEPPVQPAHVDLCAHWLYRFLVDAGAPVKPAAVVRAAAEAGFPRTTLYRARRLLAGSIVELGSSPRDPTKRWALAAGLRDDCFLPG